jgi:hypothetical protein
MQIPVTFPATIVKLSIPELDTLSSEEAPVPIPDPAISYMVLLPVTFPFRMLRFPMTERTSKRA